MQFYKSGIIFCFMLRNQSIAIFVFFHQFTINIVLSSELFLSGIILLSSVLVSFTRLHVGFLLKFPLWYFSVINACDLATQFIRLFRSNGWAIFFSFHVNIQGGPKDLSLPTSLPHCRDLCKPSEIENYIMEGVTSLSNHPVEQPFVCGCFNEHHNINLFNS